MMQMIHYWTIVLHTHRSLSIIIMNNDDDDDDKFTLVMARLNTCVYIIINE